MLRQGVGDLGLVTLPVEASDLVSVPILTEELLLVTYPTHPLAKRRQITPADLNQEPFILFETGSITRRLVDEFFTRQGVEAHVVMETENVEIIKAMVRSGLGISIVPWQVGGGRGQEQAAGLQPHRRPSAVPPDRLGLSEDEPAASDGERGDAACWRDCGLGWKPPSSLVGSGSVSR